MQQKLRHSEAMPKNRMGTGKKREFIMRLFEGIEETDLQAMLKCLNAVQKSYYQGEMIFLEGEEITSACLIVKGKVQLIKDDFEGNKVILSEMREGETFGEAYVFSGLKAIPISALSVEDTTVMYINFNRIITMCNSACTFHRKLIENTIKLIANKNIHLSGRIELLSKKTIRERILFYLQSEKLKNKNSEFEIPFSRNSLAEYLCADRSALSRELCNLRNEKVLEFNKNYFKLM